MSNRSLNDAGPEKWTLPRRDFLVLGSAAVFGAAASSVTASTLRSVAAPSVGSILSIGYAEAAASPVVPASALRTGADSLRHSGARVLVHGLSSQPEGEACSVNLSVFAPVGGAAVPFLAWAHRTDRNARTVTSPRVSFLAALDDDGTLPIAIERTVETSRWTRRFLAAAPAVTALPDLASLEQTGNVCRLSSGNAGDARLRPGTYFIALRRSASDRQPDWSSIEIDPTVTDASDSLRRHGLRVAFDYVAVTITAPTV